jgi:hypothetical protein
MSTNASTSPPGISWLVILELSKRLSPGLRDYVPQKRLHSEPHLINEPLFSKARQHARKMGPLWYRDSGESPFDLVPAQGLTRAGQNLQNYSFKWGHGAQRIGHARIG